MIDMCYFDSNYKAKHIIDKLSTTIPLESIYPCQHSRLVTGVHLTAARQARRLMTCDTPMFIPRHSDWYPSQNHRQCVVALVTTPDIFWAWCTMYTLYMTYGSATTKCLRIHCDYGLRIHGLIAAVNYLQQLLILNKLHITFISLLSH